MLLSRRLAVFALALGFVDRAAAAGLYASDRGVRPLGRAGAFVAGADDANAVSYNPAGLSYAGTTVLADASVVLSHVTYDRVVRVVDADGAIVLVHSPTIEGSSSFLPYPSAIGTWAINDRWTLAGGLTVPYVSTVDYPPSSPGRYAMGSFDGSIGAAPGVWAAYRATPWLRVGAGVSALTGMFKVQTTVNISPDDRLIGAPEQTDYDATAHVKLGPVFAPMAHVGVIVQPLDQLKIGLSAQSPAWIDAPASVDLDLPPAFSRARQGGRDADVELVLPPVVRIGVEARPIDRLRLELAYAHEFWSMHDTIEVHSDGFTIEGIPGAPPSIGFRDFTVPRGYTDAGSIRLGGELRVQAGDIPIDLRAGVSRDASAVPTSRVSLLSLDSERYFVTVGAGVYIGQVRLDAFFGHQFVTEVTIRPEEAAVGRISPLGGASEPVNGGRYSMSVEIIGLGGAYRFR